MRLEQMFYFQLSIVNNSKDNENTEPNVEYINIFSMYSNLEKIK